MELIPRYNIAPTQMAPVVVVVNGEKVLKPMRWGLIPFWAKDPGIGSHTINARVETVREKPAFRSSFKRKRCLVVADSLYEWQKLPGTQVKQPIRILLKEEHAFGFAGLWDSWTSPEGSEVETFTILTGQPNSLVAEIHTRMAVILPRQHHDAWLDPEYKDTEQLCDLLAPFPSEEMKLHPVSAKVNNARFEDPQCIEPLNQQLLL